MIKVEFDVKNKAPSTQMIEYWRDVLNSYLEKRNKLNVRLAYFGLAETVVFLLASLFFSFQVGGVAATSFVITCIVLFKVATVALFFYNIIVGAAFVVFSVGGFVDGAWEGTSSPILFYLSLIAIYYCVLGCRLSFIMSDLGGPLKIVIAGNENLNNSRDELLSDEFGEEDYEVLAKWANANADSKAYREGVLSQKRRFLKAEIEMLKAHWELSEDTNRKKANKAKETAFYNSTFAANDSAAGS